MSNNPLNNNDKVAYQQKLVLGLGFLAIFFSNQGISILAIPYYQMTLGVDPFYLSLAMKLPVLAMSFVMPFIGRFSDNYQSQYGRRRPFLFFFPWVSAFLYGVIWMVPAEWPAQLQLLYFSLLTILFYFFTAMWTMPLKCLVIEATDNQHERTKLMGFVNYFVKFGGLVYHWVFPLAKLSIFGGVIIGIQYVGWGIALIFLGLFAMLPGLLIKEKNTITPIDTPDKTVKNPPLFSSIKQALRNKNLRILLAMIVVQIALGHISGSMDYYVLVYYMSGGDIGSGATLKGILSTSYAIFGFLSLAILIKLSGQLGKKNTMKIVYSLTIFGGLMKWFIYQPGNDWLLPLDALLCCSIWVSMAVVVSSMIADQIDVDRKQNKLRREGMFVSIQNATAQIALACAAIFSGLLLNLIGFDALLLTEQQDSSLLLMRLFLVAGTVTAAVTGLWLVSHYDYDEKNQPAT